VNYLSSKAMVKLLTSLGLLSMMLPGGHAMRIRPGTDFVLLAKRSKRDEPAGTSPLAPVDNQPPHGLIDTPPVPSPIDDTAPVPAPPGCRTVREFGDLLDHWDVEVLRPEEMQCFVSASSEEDKDECYCARDRKLVAHWAELSEREACGTMYDPVLQFLKSTSYFCEGIPIDNRPPPDQETKCRDLTGDYTKKEINGELANVRIEQTGCSGILTVSGIEQSFNHHPFTVSGDKINMTVRTSATDYEDSGIIVGGSPYKIVTFGGMTFSPVLPAGPIDNQPVPGPIDNQPAPPECPTLDELRHWREEALAPEFEQCMASATSSEKDVRACHCALSRKLVAHYADLSEREACGTMYDEVLEDLKWMERAQCEDGPIDNLVPPHFVEVLRWIMNEPGAELPPDLGAGPLMDTLQFLRSVASGNVTWPSLPEGVQLPPDTKEITSKTTTRPPADAEAAKEKDGVAQLSLLLPTLLTLVRAWGC